MDLFVTAASKRPDKSRGVVAITSPSHGEGRGFNPRRDYFCQLNATLKPVPITE